MSERVAAAALIDECGNVFTLPPPARHHTLIRALAERGDPTPISGEQGFVTNEGEFVGRETAFEIALSAGQIDSALRLHATVRKLFSEDLW